MDGSVSPNRPKFRVSSERGNPGGQESQDLLWRRVWTQVLQWLRKRLRSLHDAEDLAAECMRLALLRFGHSLPQWAELRPWVLLAARHRLISFRRRPTVSKPIDPVDLDWRLCGGSFRESDAGDEGNVAASLALRASEGDQVTFAMLSDGASVAEIAVVRKISPRAVRDSRKRLRLHLLTGKNDFQLPFSASSAFG
jgi:DNA-directed RNA polymerase specialized sigma24 family protein